MGSTITSTVAGGEAVYFSNIFLDTPTLVLFCSSYCIVANRTTANHRCRVSVKIIFNKKIG